jgi:type IV pilus assembly protein PilC
MAPTFNYSAKDREGKTVTGTMEAGSDSEVAGALRERHLLPNRISVSRGVPSIPNGHFLERILLSQPISEQIYFFKQVATMLSAGVPLADAMRKIVSRSQGGRLRGAIMDAEQHVSSGGRLSEALGRYPWLFGRLQLSLIEAGESSGLLDQSISQVAEYLEKELASRRRMSAATLYPKIALVMALALLKLPIPLLQQALGPLTHLPEVLIAIAIVVWLAFRLSVQSQPLAYAWDAAKLSFPMIGSLLQKMALIKFARALAALYSAGVPVATSVELAAGASSNAFISSRLSRAAPLLRNGVDPLTALSRTGALTDLVQDMLSTGQMTGNLDGMMEKVAEYYESETESGLHKLTIVIGVLALLIAGIITGVIVITFYAGVYGAMGK